MPTCPPSRTVRRGRGPARRDASPIPTAGWRTGRAPTPGRGPSAQNALTRVATSPRVPGAGADPRPPRRAARHRRAQRADAGARPLLLPAARRPAEPAGAVRARGSRTARTASPIDPNALDAAAPPRSTGTIPATTAGSSPTACPRTAASRACCTCSTSTRGALLPDRIPRTRAADLAWLPDGTGLLLHPLSRAGRGARGRGALPPRRLLPPRSAPIPRTTRWSSSRPRRSTGPA